MASEKTTDIICKVFISTFVDGEDMWKQVLIDLKADGGTTPLFDKRYFFEILLVEWAIARFGWLFRQSENITNKLTKSIMLNEINSQMNEAFNEPEYKRAFIEYYMLAVSFDNNELDSLDLKMTPGPIILKRYLDKISFEHQTLTSLEELAIMITGDTSCWYLEKSLNEILESVLQNID